MRCQDFSSLPRRERRAYPSAVCEERATPAAAKRTATRRAAPELTGGFVAPQSQSAGGLCSFVAPRHRSNLRQRRDRKFFVTGLAADEGAEEPRSSARAHD